MDRRRFLALAATSSAFLAGCMDSESQTPTEQTATSSRTRTPTRTVTDPPTQTELPTETETETPEPQSDTVFVGPDGNDADPGTESEPVASISYAVNDIADPGDTVHVLPGEYVEHAPLSQSGTADAPITLTGPLDAVLRPERGGHLPIAIRGNHIHITGLTITGLFDPENPEDPDSYFSGKLIGASAIDLRPDGVEYLQGLVISPHRIGNAGQSLMNFTKIRDAEIGGFEVIGPAGANWLFEGSEGHNGEFVYLGTAPPNVQRRDDLEEYDRTRNVRVHHIDNSAGHAHSELVDCKIGTQNITIEYCTDGGGVQSKDSYYSRAISMDGHGCTMRWNIIQDAQGHGIRIGPQDFLNDAAEYSMDEEPQTEFERTMGKEHTIYGNVFTGNTADAIDFLRESKRPGRASNPLPADQRALCGNLYDAYTDGSPGGACGDDLPAGDNVGHLGGESPWDGAAPTKTEAFEEHAQDQHLDVTVHEDTVPTDTDFEIPITVRNTGDSTDDVVLRLRIRQYDLDERTVTVSPDETRETSVRENLPNSGEMAVTRNGQKTASVYLTDES